MHVLKLKAKDIYKVLSEKDRSGNSREGDIDSSRTYLNQNLAPEGRNLKNSDDIKAYIEKTFNLTRKIKGDAVLAVSCIIDKPKDCTVTDKDFFKASYDFCLEHFCGGDERKVLQAYTHVDEDHPHMNFVYVPVIVGKSKKTNKKTDEVTVSEKVKLSAKEQLTRSFLFELHPALTKYMEEHGIDGSFYDPEAVKNRETKNMSMLERKAYLDQKKAVSALMTELGSLTSQVEKARKRLDTIDTLEWNLEQTVSALRSEELVTKRTLTEYSNKLLQIKADIETATAEVEKALEIEPRILQMQKDLKEKEQKLKEEYEQKKAKLEADVKRDYLIDVTKGIQIEKDKICEDYGIPQWGEVAGLLEDGLAYRQSYEREYE